jgi:hypothetical protein
MASMCSTLRFFVVRRVLSVPRHGPKPDDKDVEIAVLRHRLAIVQRQVPRLRYKDTIVSCCRCWPSSCLGPGGVFSSTLRRPCCAGVATSSVGVGRSLSGCSAPGLPTRRTSWCCASPGKTAGKTVVGITCDRRGVRQGRGEGLGVIGSRHLGPPPPRTGAARRAERPGSGSWAPRRPACWPRLVHRRDGAPAAVVCPVLHRARATPGLPDRCHRQS